MIAKDLADYLQTRGLGNVGTDIFVGELPIDDESGNTIDNGIYVVATGGDGQDSYLDTMYEQFDIWSVHPLYESAYNALEAVRNVLSRATNYDLTNYYVYFSHDISGIMDLDRTRDGLKLYKMTIRLIYNKKNVIS